MNNNQWSADDSDSDYDEEYIQNEVPPNTVDKDFIENVLKVKHSLYDNIVLSPELGTTEAQDNNILQQYLNKIHHMYVLSINAQNGIKYSDNDEELKEFPSATRDIIKQTLTLITDFFSKNTIPDTIPYSDFIRKSFHEYQFIQNKSFE
jgi:hypothetical protein